MELTFSESKTKSREQDPATRNHSFSPPAKAAGLIVFTPDEEFGAGKSRSREIARVFQRNRLGTLLWEAPPSRTNRNGESIALHAQQLTAMVEWVIARDLYRGLPVALFAANDGAAVSLIAAAELGHRINSIALCAGQLNGARTAFSKVKSPTLLIVGGRDTDTIEANERAARLMRCEKSLAASPI